MVAHTKTNGSFEMNCGALIKNKDKISKDKLTGGYKILIHIKISPRNG